MSGSNDWKQTACHEIGHSAGLNHNVNDCMSQDPDLLTYNAHHITHIAVEVT